MTDALIVFAKVPAAGQVKTRLVPDLDEVEAAALYEAFLLDALDAYSALNMDVRLYFAPSEAEFDSIDVPDSVQIVTQAGEGLGERMARAFVETFAVGYDRVAIVGTDHPTLPSSFIEYAFETLSSPKSIAIGPVDDGGYYLLAMREFFPQLFRDMSYSHESVFQETLQRCAAVSPEVAVLPLWYDVDTPADLRRLRSDLAENLTTAPRTVQQLERLSARYAWLS